MGERVVRRSPRPLAPSIVEDTPTRRDPNPELQAVGVADPAAAERARIYYLGNFVGDRTQPFCTCSVRGKYGYRFDPNIGVYLHSDPKCWKPSKAMYEECIRAGIIEPPDPPAGGEQLPVDSTPAAESPPAGARRVIRTPR